MSVDYPDRDQAGPVESSLVDGLLAYLTLLFREQPVGASICAGFALGAISGSGIAMLLGAVAAYVLTEPLRRIRRSD